MTGQEGPEDRARRRAKVFRTFLRGGKARAQALRLRYLRAVTLRKALPMTHPALLVATCVNCAPSCPGHGDVKEHRKVKAGGTYQRRECTKCKPCKMFVRPVPPTPNGAHH